MSAFSDEYARIRKRARDLGKKGLGIDQVYERVRAMCVYCDPPQRDTVADWMKRDEKPKNHGGGKPKQRVIASDGRVFESVTKAAEELGVSKTAMFKALREDRKCRGLEIKYKED